MLHKTTTSQMKHRYKGFGRVGELMLVHECQGCEKVSINRIARDDYEDGILNVFEQSLRLDPAQFARRDIELLEELEEIRRQLYGA